jgi:NADPH:quinone reductase-like Zn-dependent oxidoreductase
MDIGQRSRKYPLPPQIPKTMGVEYSGVIEELGPETGEEVEDFKVGDEVFGLAYGGRYTSITQRASNVETEQRGLMSDF